MVKAQSSEGPNIETRGLTVKHPYCVMAPAVRLLRHPSLLSKVKSLIVMYKKLNISKPKRHRSFSSFLKSFAEFIMGCRLALSTLWVKERFCDWVNRTFRRQVPKAFEAVGIFLLTTTK